MKHEANTPTEGDSDNADTQSSASSAAGTGPLVDERRAAFELQTHGVCCKRGFSDDC